MSGGKVRWGDLKWGDVDGDADAEPDDSKVASSSSSSSARGGASSVKFATVPDKDGVKTITEFRTGDDGKKIKVIRTVKETKVVTKVNKNVLKRRQWAKFGDCRGFAPGPEENITYVSYEKIQLSLKPRKREEKQEDEEDPLAKLQKGGDSFVVCRLCGETGHWTLKCPKRGEIQPKHKSTPNSTGGSSSGSGDVRAGASSSTLTKGKYVPVHLRGGGPKMAGSNMSGTTNDRERDDSSTIRVTNISEDTTEDDLRELFRRFGHTSRIYLAKDRQTRVSRGFAFISYQTREAAQLAIDKLNGYGYDNLILHLEFANPREPSPNAPPAGGDANGGGGAGKPGWTMQGTK